MKKRLEWFEGKRSLVVSGVWALSAVVLLLAPEEPAWPLALSSALLASGNFSEYYYERQLKDLRDRNHKMQTLLRLNGIKVPK